MVSRCLLRIRRRSVRKLAGAHTECSPARLNAPVIRKTWLRPIVRGCANRALPGIGVSRNSVSRNQDRSGSLRQARVERNTAALLRSMNMASPPTRSVDSIASLALCQRKIGLTTTTTTHTRHFFLPIRRRRRRMGRKEKMGGCRNRLVVSKRNFHWHRASGERSVTGINQ